MIKFEVVDEKHRKVYEVFTDSKNGKHRFPRDIKLPQRATAGSSGFDFFLAEDVMFMPGKPVFIPTDVKAIMPVDVELQLRNRSSLAIKHDLQLINNPATIDSDFANNPDNGGNITLVFINRSGTTVKLKAGDKVCQGIFAHYLVTDDDAPVSEVRTGGIGSTDV